MKKKVKVYVGRDSVLENVLIIHLGVLLGQLHVVEDAEQDLEQVLPPMRLERSPMGLHHIEENGKGTRAHIELATANHTRELEEQREPAPYLIEKNE